VRTRRRSPRPMAPLGGLFEHIPVRLKDLKLGEVVTFRQVVRGQERWTPGEVKQVGRKYAYVPVVGHHPARPHREGRGQRPPDGVVSSVKATRIPGRTKRPDSAESGGNGQSRPSLPPRDWQVCAWASACELLDFERARPWERGVRPVPKEVAIRLRFGVSPASYSYALLQVLDWPAAVLYAPDLVNRLTRIRDRRRQLRFASRLRPLAIAASS
jgi:hypothetical protein